MENSGSSCATRCRRSSRGSREALQASTLRRDRACSTFAMDAFRRYFEVLALQPVMGRTFSEDEDRPRGPKAVVVSYSLWRNIFGGDPGIVGRSILLKGEPHTLVGVLAQ